MVRYPQISAAYRRHGAAELGADDAICQSAAARGYFHCGAAMCCSRSSWCAARYRSSRCGARRRIAILHLGDPVLAPLGRLAKLFRIPVCVTVHGLDITYPHPMYRLWLRIFSTASMLTSASAGRHAKRQSRAACLNRNQNRRTGRRTASGSNREREADLLLFVGRLVRRKGLEWFVRDVLPKIAERRPAVRLAVVGAGPERRAIRQAAATAGVAIESSGSALLRDTERASLLLRATVCVAPNVMCRATSKAMEWWRWKLRRRAARLSPRTCMVCATQSSTARVACSLRPGTPTSGPATVVELLDDSRRAAALGARARAWALSERSWNAVCDRYDDVFNAIA